MNISPTAMREIIRDFLETAEKLRGPYVHPSPSRGTQHRAMEEFLARVDAIRLKDRSWNPKVNRRMVDMRVSLKELMTEPVK